MEKEQVLVIKDEFIKLGQAMKLAGLVDSGTDAKTAVREGKVKVDGQIEDRRGRKMYDGMSFEYDGQIVRINSCLPTKPI